MAIRTHRQGRRAGLAAEKKQIGRRDNQNVSKEQEGRCLIVGAQPSCCASPAHHSLQAAEIAPVQCPFEGDEKSTDWVENPSPAG